MVHFQSFAMNAMTIPEFNQDYLRPFCFAVAKFVNETMNVHENNIKKLLDKLKTMCYREQEKALLLPREHHQVNRGAGTIMSLLSKCHLKFLNVVKAPGKLGALQKTLTDLASMSFKINEAANQCLSGFGGCRCQHVFEPVKKGGLAWDFL